MAFHHARQSLLPKPEHRSAELFSGLLNLLPPVDLVMTSGTQSDEINFGIITKFTSRTHVVNLKVSRTSAVLTAPSVSREHLAGQVAIRVGFKAQSRLFRFE